MSIVLGPKIFLSAIVALLILGYAYHRTEDLLWGPRLAIVSPQNGVSVTAPLLRITGTTKNSAALTINGHTAFTNDSGEFSEDILLAHGYNALEVRAEDKFGRMEIKKIEVVRK
ncbi:MAG: hypothetical protein HYS73_00080 [Parcubacteria group bacterium]|nr:hypothetical protein [Parcubacteria group bacterium]MBI2049229.1 hypothetical protein [Parcubacteria group bacterium]